MHATIRILTVLLSFIAWPLLKAQAQQSVPAHAQQPATEADITAIRATFQKINTTALTRKEFKYEAENCVDGGLITYYFDKGDMVKVVESGAIGDGSWTREFYYASGKPIFFYEVNIGGPAAGPEIRTAYRIYMKDDKIIRYMEDKKAAPMDNERCEVAVKVAYKVIKAYTTKDFAGALCGN